MVFLILVDKANLAHSVNRLLVEHTEEHLITLGSNGAMKYLKPNAGMQKSKIIEGIYFIRLNLTRNPSKNFD
jgi:hypothetical protein